jgi:hypothetical protein
MAFDALERSVIAFADASPMSLGQEVQVRKDRIIRLLPAAAIATSLSIALLAAAPTASTAGAGSPPRRTRPVGPVGQATNAPPPDASSLPRSASDEALVRRAAIRQREQGGWHHRPRTRDPARVTRTRRSEPGGSVRDLVATIFRRIAGAGQVPTALCVAERESRFDPNARNGRSSAAGVFQWVASSWAGYSARYGFGGASVFDPYANIMVAARAVADGGWGPWGGGCP